MRKSTSVLMLLFAIIFMMTSCSSNPLKSQTKSISSQLPLKFADWASVTEANFDKSDNAVNLVLDIKDNGRINMDLINQEKGDLATGMALFFYGPKGSLQSMASSLVSNKGALSFTFRDAKSKKTVTTIVSADQVTRLLGSGQVPPLDELKGKVAIGNLTAPNDFDDFNKLGQMKVTRDNLEVTLLVSPKAFRADLDPKALKNYIAQDVLVDIDLKQFTALAAKAGIGAIFDYTNASTGKKLTTGFSKDELLENEGR
ncbi:MAG: hypothetical protein LKH70_11285 [Prevotella sp.]|jgi:hypothetical protein|nr:hypothetical protein [Prevotella sp.]MCI1550353.1 hypothetical protein [Prevotella sp.]